MRKHVVAAVVAVVALVAVVVLSLGFATAQPEPAQANPAVTAAQAAPLCSVTQRPKSIRIVCRIAGVVALDTVIPLPQLPPVTLPPITLPPVTELIPGQTATVRVPGPTQTVVDRETVRVPGPTRTETTRVPRSTETVTETTSPDAPGQTGGDDDTIEPDRDRVDIGDGDVTVEEVGLGLLAILGIVGLLLLAMWGGYYIGYRDADRENADFMDALSTETVRKRRGKHS